jgi:hypothetical protein
LQLVALIERELFEVARDGGRALRLLQMGDVPCRGGNAAMKT